MRGMSSSIDDPLSVPAAIEKRRSVRHFEPDPIPDDVLQRLIDLSVMAPTSWNLQPVRMVVVRDAEQRAKLQEACYYQPQVKEAPVSFVFAIEIGAWREHMDEVIEIAAAAGAWTPEYIENYRKFATGSQESLGDALREFDTKDALITATHLALAAESMGLGSCFMNGYAEDKVKAVIGAADRDDIGVSLVMPIGTPAQRGGNPGRLPLSKTVFAGDLATPWKDA
jgi:nitroreductase